MVVDIGLGILVTFLVSLRQSPFLTPFIDPFLIFSNRSSITGIMLVHVTQQYTMTYDFTHDL